MGKERKGATGAHDAPTTRNGRGALPGSSGKAWAPGPPESLTAADYGASRFTLGGVFRGLGTQVTEGGCSLRGWMET